MWKYPKKYDVVVIGAGHAGCEAAFISAKKGVKTLLLTSNLDTIAKLSCNPAIGGSAKSHIVREIDALGGIMAKITDKTKIHTKILNLSKGPAVHASRAQVDRVLYHLEMKRALEEIKNLDIKQHIAEEFIIKEDKILAVVSAEKIIFETTCVIIATGTFLKGKIFIGDFSFSGGRGADFSSKLSNFLKKIGIKIKRLKTGTPPRIHESGIDFKKLKKQKSEKNINFSFEKVKTNFIKKQKDCFLTYTTENTKKIIEKNVEKAAIFSKIKSKGPRYCPSIEDKIIRFQDKKRHQVFLEPEGLYTKEFYVNGISSSMPIDVQHKIVRSIIGLEKAEIMRPAYAIEYDSIKSGQIKITLESKKIKNLFFAGQINGTTGYEEAAAQGLVAGINAANKVLKQKEFILNRFDAYIGVLIDDLFTTEITEPYRMFTSRAEYRLSLRQDNADLRLFEHAKKENTISKTRYLEIKKKKETIENIKKEIEKKFIFIEGKKFSLNQILKRPNYDYKIFKKFFKDLDEEILRQIEIEIKYKGYIDKQKREIKRLSSLENVFIPKDFCFDSVKGLRTEAREKLKQFTPKNLFIASRIDGISPADISILLIQLQRSKK